jgi:hypothetical protein
VVLSQRIRLVRLKWFLVHYKDNLRSAIQTAKPIVDEAMQSYDEMIRQIEESEAWRN